MFHYVEDYCFEIKNAIILKLLQQKAIEAHYSDITSAIITIIQLYKLSLHAGYCEWQEVWGTLYFMYYPQCVTSNATRHNLSSLLK